MAKWILPGFLLVFVVLLLLGFIADGIFPAYSMQGSTYVFHGSYTIAIILFDIAFLFAALLLLVILTSSTQVRTGGLSSSLALRRVFVGIVFGIILAGTLFTSIYVFTKHIDVSQVSVSYTSLIERREVLWSQVTRVNGNFVPGSRMGLLGRGDYAWVEFDTRDRGPVIFSLRFMQGVTRFEQVVRQMHE